MLPANFQQLMQQMGGMGGMGGMDQEALAKMLGGMGALGGGGAGGAEEDDDGAHFWGCGRAGLGSSRRGSGTGCTDKTQQRDRRCAEFDPSLTLSK
jgi:hypothetical protein